MDTAAAPEWSDQVHEADWIADRLSQVWTVASVVPGGFEAYARVLHPADEPENGRSRLVRWREVAEWSGKPLDSDSQFHSIGFPAERRTAESPVFGIVRGLNEVRTHRRKSARVSLG
jgi:hypothetical protein